MKHALSGLLFTLLTGGCLASGGVHYGVSAAVIAPPPPSAEIVVSTGPAPQGGVYVEPDLVEVSPGIQVIYDYDQPIFFSDGYYWRNDGGVWYSSHVYTGGWGRVSYPPERFRTIQTSAYVHYRPSGYVPRAQREPNVRDHREPVRQEPVVRDHREPMREPVRQEPVVRDHREPMPVRQEPVRQEPVVRDHREAPPAPAPVAAPVVRDHRTAPPPPAAPPPPPPPVVRDHRKK